MFLTLPHHGNANYKVKIEETTQGQVKASRSRWVGEVASSPQLIYKYGHFAISFKVFALHCHDSHLYHCCRSLFLHRFKMEQIRQFEAGCDQANEGNWEVGSLKTGAGS